MCGDRFESRSGGFVVLFDAVTYNDPFASIMLRQPILPVQVDTEKERAQAESVSGFN